MPQAVVCRADGGIIAVRSPFGRHGHPTPLAHAFSSGPGGGGASPGRDGVAEDQVCRGAV